MWCDNAVAGKNTQKEGCHKLCDFDDPVEVIKANLKFREMTGTKAQMSNTHRDKIKQILLRGHVKVKCVSSKDNPAEIFTKPLEYGLHSKFIWNILRLEGEPGRKGNKKREN